MTMENNNRIKDKNMTPKELKINLDEFHNDSDESKDYDE